MEHIHEICGEFHTTLTERIECIERNLQSEVENIVYDLIAGDKMLIVQQKRGLGEMTIGGTPQPPIILTVQINPVFDKVRKLDEEENEIP